MDRMGSITVTTPASFTEGESSKVVSQEVPVHYLTSALSMNSGLRAHNTMKWVISHQIHMLAFIISLWILFHKSSVAWHIHTQKIIIYT